MPTPASWRQWFNAGVLLRSLHRAVLSGFIGLLIPFHTSLLAQERGVSLSLTAQGSNKTALIVMPVEGLHGDSIAAIVNRDLTYSDRFTMVQWSAGAKLYEPVNYSLLAKLGADGAVAIRLTRDGKAIVSLHDIGARAVRFSKVIALPSPALSSEWRMAVHGIADSCEEWLTGQRGIAQTRIAFERAGRLFVVDSDGANVRPITTSGMSPQWLPSGTGIVYSVMDGRRNPVLLTELTTGAQRTLAVAEQTEHTSPAVSPDGRTMLYARVSANGTDIFAQPLSGGAVRRVTVGRGRVSTQPSFSRDGLRFVFMSDRSGHPDLYISDLDGTNVELLTTASFGDNDYRSGPDWSPDGRLVAFASRNNKIFQIMTINLADQSVKQITNAGRNEDPSWAPDSRHLVFTSTMSGNRQLWIADTRTGKARQLTFGGEARLAAWSPRLTVN